MGSKCPKQISYFHLKCHPRYSQSMARWEDTYKFHLSSPKYPIDHMIMSTFQMICELSWFYHALNSPYVPSIIVWIFKSHQSRTPSMHLKSFSKPFRHTSKTLTNLQRLIKCLFWTERGAFLSTEVKKESTKKGKVIVNYW